MGNKKPRQKDAAFCGSLLVLCQNPVMKSPATQYLETLPDHIRKALADYADATGYPVEAVLEMAIAFFLDEDCAGLEDCRVESPGQMRSRLEVVDAEARDQVTPDRLLV